MNSKKRSLEQRLSVITAIVLLLAMLSIFFILVIIQTYPINPSYLLLSLCIGGGVLFLHLILFPREDAAHPLLCSILSFLLCVGATLCVIGCSYTSFEYEVKNPYYETELAEWEKNKTTVDPTPDTPYTLGDAAYNRMNGRPEETLKVEPDGIYLLMALLVIAICSFIVAGAIYIIYCFICVHRFVTPINGRHKEKMTIRSREKAYAEIAKFHDYMERGIMTEEEYTENRQRILDTLK